VTSSIAASLMPEASCGVWISVRHQSVSVSAIRRRLSPLTRSHCSMTAGRKPFRAAA
jgi:hypothetical protein